jgi:hypothetical protein
MNIQEAYNKGLDDAEAVVIDKICSMLNEHPTTPFVNPKLEEVRQRLIKVVTAKPAPVDTMMEPNPFDNFRGVVRLILMGEEDAITLAVDTKDVPMLKVIQARSDHYRSIAGGKSRIGKQFKKSVEDQLTLLNSVLN